MSGKFVAPWSRAWLAASVVWCSITSVHAAPTIDPEADRIFHAASQYLAASRAFGVKVEVWRDAVLPSGTVIQTTRTLDIQEQRPDKLKIEVHSPRESRGFWYQNKSLILLDRNTNFYGVIPITAAPGDIDTAIDAVEDEFGIELPLGDVLVADPYANMISNIESGKYLGRATILGVVCHHLLFTGRSADCQVWIADGPKPLPKKIVISMKTDSGRQQVTQLFSDWDLVSPISDSVFTFVPPKDSIKVIVNPKKNPSAVDTSAATVPASK